MTEVEDSRCTMRHRGWYHHIRASRSTVSKLAGDEHSKSKLMYGKDCFDLLQNESLQFVAQGSQWSQARIYLIQCMILP
jgi:hypothetical protein